MSLNPDTLTVSSPNMPVFDLNYFLNNAVYLERNNKFIIFGLTWHNWIKTMIYKLWGNQAKNKLKPRRQFPSARNPPLKFMSHSISLLINSYMNGPTHNATSRKKILLNTIHCLQIECKITFLRYMYTPPQSQDFIYIQLRFGTCLSMFICKM